MDIEQIVKEQYAKIFKKEDWNTFKLMADYYFETAAKILKADIGIDEPFKLMGRNIQKRLFIGIGAELLLKSLFLKNDFCINKVKNDKTLDPKKPTKFSAMPNQEMLNPSDTYTLNTLIDEMPNVITFSDNKIVKKGLKIAKVFRNKEGHVVVLWHKPDRQNYTDIENAIMAIYKEGFKEKLEYKISFMDGEEAKFEKKKLITNNG